MRGLILTTRSAQKQLLKLINTSPGYLATMKHLATFSTINGLILCPQDDGSFVVGVPFFPLGHGGPRLLLCPQVPSFVC